MQIYAAWTSDGEPTPEQRRLVYHHLIDIVDPRSRTASAIICATPERDRGDPEERGNAHRGRGTASISGADEGPAPRAAGRPRAAGATASEEAENGEGTLYADLARRDPESAIKIHPNDLRRTIRALEVFLLRDRKLSDLQRNMPSGTSPTLPAPLSRAGRSELYPRIERRVDEMIARARRRGERAHAQGLQQGPGLHAGLGYSHFLEYFSNRRPPARPWSF